MLKIIKNTLPIILIMFLFVGTGFSQSDLGDINSQLTEKKQEIEEQQARIKKLNQSIDARRSQASSLSNQISIINSQSEKVEAEIQLTRAQIDQANLEISQTQVEIAQTEKSIEADQGKLAAFIRELYKLDQQSSLEIILVNESISDFFNQFEANLKLQNNLKVSIVGLKDTKSQLNIKVRSLDERKENLNALGEKLVGDNERLESQSAVRAQLLSETRNSEARFQQLLREAKAEQIKINADIQSLEKVIRDRLSKEGKNSLAKLSGGKLIYPVPFKGITTYFHDPDYPYRYIFEHPALDLRAAQGTPLKAAGAGFVARTRDAGLGYSYIMLIHADNISTVYGHVSQILVTEDEFVNQGDIIGLSGGRPGSAGAGRLTTGPHLHFEVRLNGIPVNPLNYL